MRFTEEELGKFTEEELAAVGLAVEYGDRNDPETAGAMHVRTITEEGKVTNAFWTGEAPLYYFWQDLPDLRKVTPVVLWALVQLAKNHPKKADKVLGPNWHGRKAFNDFPFELVWSLYVPCETGIGGVFEVCIRTDGKVFSHADGGLPTPIEFDKALALARRIENLYMRVTP